MTEQLKVEYVGLAYGCEEYPLSKQDILEKMKDVEGDDLLNYARQFEYPNHCFKIIQGEDALLEEYYYTRGDKILTYGDGYVFVVVDADEHSNVSHQYLLNAYENLDQSS